MKTYSGITNVVHFKFIERILYYNFNTTCHCIKYKLDSGGDLRTTSNVRVNRFRGT